MPDPNDEGWTDFTWVNVARVRLHSVRFHFSAVGTDEWARRADFVRDLMSLHGCYLQKCWDSANDRLVWVARYE